MAAKKKKEAEGIKNVSAPWNVSPDKVTPENIPMFQSNIHYQTGINNLTAQVFAGRPELWVTDAEGETDETLTEELKQEFERLGCYDLMMDVLADCYGYGAAVFSVGMDREGGAYHITEIRHLPSQTFRQHHSSANSIVNPLLPGIEVTPDGETEVWQTNLKTFQQTKLENVTIVRLPGTPNPSGSAYMYPVYHLISMIEFASKAETQQVNRVGAPILLPKVSDEAGEDIYKDLQDWARQFTKNWGKDTVGLIPPGIEFPTLNFRENTVAQTAVDRWVKWIHDYLNPMAQMQETGGLGTSDSGRMEMWANFITSRQEMCESWLEDEFNLILQANGYSGYHTNIQLKRPSIDRANTKLQYLAFAKQAGAVTAREIRDNMTDILELQEWSDDIEQKLKEDNQSSALASIFSNVSDGFEGKEESQVERLEKKLREINESSEQALKKIMGW